MALSPEKRLARKGFFVVWSRSNRSALKVSLFFSKNPSEVDREGWKRVVGREDEKRAYNDTVYTYCACVCANATHSVCAHTSRVVVDSACKVYNPEQWAVGGLGLVEVGVLSVLLGQLEQHAGISALGEGRGRGKGQGRGKGRGRGSSREGNAIS